MPERKQRWRQRHQQQLTRSSTAAHLHLPDSELVAKYCPLLAAAILLPAVLLLVAPQQMLQLVAVTSSSVPTSAPTAAAEAVASCFVQLVGLTWAFNAMLSLTVKVRTQPQEQQQLRSCTACTHPSQSYNTEATSSIAADSMNKLLGA
jgi:hypothetical protein